MIDSTRTLQHRLVNVADLARVWWLAALLAVAIFVPVESAERVQFHNPDQSTAGYLLVATPELDGSNFGRTVIFMIEHDAKGAMGLVVNRPIGRTGAADLLRTMGLEAGELEGEIEVFSGGPVEPGRGFVLHSPDYKSEGTTMVHHSLAVTTRSEVIRELAAGRGPNQSLIIFGYSGWAPGQLEGEMEAGAWFTIPLDTGLVFGKDPGRSWEEAMDRRGVEL